ncbi:BIR repeat,Zinc finger, RING/FYVE/PHD-type,Zinc finger, RING-type [Cinara cedri]|uniref:BIR repeat,Zinc finger, RING/FYVE/PHD-type,Zinc finger, RING-type n=1 Tax=Cinara cedri TaxID=506608 RepID=A0A5E4NSY8_9HEMI|nr:BIR repeat,Zinc finger, RING/FYVE/PHD-type,Zinc finger, RING-type [Cinara cedri]
MQQPSRKPLESILYLQTGLSVAVQRETIKEIVYPSNRMYEPSILSDPASKIRIRWDLTILGNRLKTFRKGWKIDFISSAEMANAGFYYTGTQDLVKCVYCPKAFQYWKPGDIPQVLHKRESPDCPFFKDSQGVKPNLDKEVDRFQNFLYAIGVKQLFSVLEKNKSLTTFESRLNTFEDCTTYTGHDIFNLCKAGFYFMEGDESEDKLLCFCCNQVLPSWKNNENPWIRHSHISPNCSFIQLTMGRQYVKRNSEAMLALGHVMLDVKPKIPFTNGNNNTTNSTKRYSGDAKLLSRKKLKLDHTYSLNYSEKITNNTIPDSMLCKICLKEPLAVIFIPCGHIIACIACAVTLDECAVCRETFTITLRIFVDFKEIKNNNSGLACLPPQNTSQSTSPNSMLCKMCRKEEISVAFVPCRHVVCCFECAVKNVSCCVCSTPFYALIQVYL